MSDPKKSFVFVNDRSLFVPLNSVLNSGVFTWCAYDRRNPVCSVMGNETLSRGANAVCVLAGVKTRAIDTASESAFVAASLLHSGLVEIRPGEFGNNASAFIRS